jgi:hypothetical protein
MPAFVWSMWCITKSVCKDTRVFMLCYTKIDCEPHFRSVDLISTAM